MGKFLVVSFESRMFTNIAVFNSESHAIEYGNQKAQEIEPKFEELVKAEEAVAFSSESDECSVGRWNAYLLEVSIESKYVMALIQNRFLLKTAYGDSFECRQTANETIRDFLNKYNVSEEGLQNGFLNPHKECGHEVISLYDFDVDAWVIKI